MHYDMTVSIFPSAGKMKGGDQNSFFPGFSILKYGHHYNTLDYVNASLLNATFYKL